jgi:serine/threonine protein kinase
MSTCPTAEKIEQFLQAESSPAELAEFDSHLAYCPKCLQIAEELTRDSRIIPADGAGEIDAPTGPLLLRALDRPDLVEVSSGTCEEIGITNLSKYEGAGSDMALAMKVPSDCPSDEDLQDTLEHLSPPTRPGSLGHLGHYEILSVLGRGAFGVVFRAFDDVLQRDVAVKTLAIRLSATSPARKRFLREARTAGQVRHENVVKIHAVEERPIPHIVMEFLPGETLQQLLDRAGVLDAATVVAIARQVVDGLAAAHAVGLIHRDIKPQNIMIDAGLRLRVKITDFGVARTIDDASLTQSGVVIGTPLYMSPEQARGEPVDHRSDLFSLGSLIYTLLTGHPPFRANGAIAILKRVVEDTPCPISEKIPEAPLWLCQLVFKLMAKDPNQRYQSAEEVAAALEAGPDSPDLALLARQRQHRRVAFVLSGLAGLVGLAVVWNISGGTMREKRGVSATEMNLERAGIQAHEAPETISPSLSAAKPTPVVDPDREAAEWTVALGGLVTALGDDRQLNSVSDLPRNPFILKRVELGGVAVTDADLFHLEGLKFVEILSLAATSVTDDGFVHLRGLTNLKVLHAGRLRLTGRGFSHLKDLPQLVELWANESDITDDGLDSLEGLTRLIKLGIGKTQVTDAGMPYLKHCTGLSELWLDHTAITDAGLRQLEAIDNLIFLDVKHTAVTPKGLADFHAVRPNCRVDYDGGTIEPLH